MNSPRKRNLTDELESVLRAHSLDAPTPAASIEAILSRTVGASASEAASAGDGATVSVAEARARRRWMAPNRLFMASIAGAAAVAALISVPMMLTAEKHSTSRTSAEHSTGTFGLQSADAADKAAAPTDQRAGNAAGLAAPAASLPNGSSQFAYDSGLRPCETADLTTQLVTTGVKAPAVAIVRLTNVSSTSCLVTGFPAVQPIANGTRAPVAPAPVSPSATSGAVAEAVPTLVLAPGTFADATIDRGASAASLNSPCDVTALLVTLPNGEKTTQFPFQSTSCTFEVHPLVAATK